VEAGGVLNGTAGTATATIHLDKADADNADAVAYDTTYLTNNGWATADNGANYTKVGTYGTATFTVATGLVAYALDNNREATENLKAGLSVTDTFTLQVLDNNGVAAAAPVNATFTITGANDLPKVTGAPVTVLQEKEVSPTGRRRLEPINRLLSWSSLILTERHQPSIPRIGRMSLLVVSRHPSGPRSTPTVSSG